ncbi:MAG TPA: isoprenylcysteine carboxylmethyltransferase family protein [Anaerolineales bacterium]|nr:isoprenylcysteine carboxylmethyltransferase family protein [Anaerolineales bacterium]
MTVIKSLFFLILVPGLLLAYFPYSIAATDTELFEPSILSNLAFPLWLMGAAMMLWCFWNFTFNGKGTPAPIDPPKELVVTGFYRYVRNPMYVAGIIALTGWILWSPSLALIVAPFLFFIAAHLFVVSYEEPTLKKKFGAAYEDYLNRVPRWIPHFD